MTLQVVFPIYVPAVYVGNGGVFPSFKWREREGDYHAEVFINGDACVPLLFSFNLADRYSVVAQFNFRVPEVTPVRHCVLGGLGHVKGATVVVQRIYYRLWQEKRHCV